MHVYLNIIMGFSVVCQYFYANVFCMYQLILPLTFEPAANFCQTSQGAAVSDVTVLKVSRTTGILRKRETLQARKLSSFHLSSHQSTQREQAERQIQNYSLSLANRL